MDATIINIVVRQKNLQRAAQGCRERGELRMIHWLIESDDVSAPSVGALHTLLEVSIHEAPAALHDMASTSVTPLSPHLRSWLGPCSQGACDNGAACVNCETIYRGM